ncbi:MAG: exodeoxyribonuclease VII small subunit [Lysobacteraceae bacterium]
MATSRKKTTADTGTSDNSSAVADFEKSLESLETLVQRMEEGELSLDDSLAAYERGIALYRRCQTALEQAELRVRQLSDPGDPASATEFTTKDSADGE